MKQSVLTIVHYIFLTREQRYVLNIPEAEIEVIGFCTPVWEKTTKIVEEVFVKYVIRHCPEPEKQTINIIPEGFLIRLSPDIPEHLLDYRDNGTMHLNLIHKNIVQIDNEISTIEHFLKIEDIRVLEETLC